MAQIKACIFDLDGTLLDTPSGITYHINQTFAQEGISPVGEDFVKTVLGNGARHLISSILESKSVTDASRVEQILNRYINLYDRDPLYLVKPYDGIVEMLSQICARGIKLAVVSNKPHYATVEMVRHFFGDSISCVLGGKEGVPLKPAPDQVFAVMKELSVTPGECAFIGDGETDVLVAKNAGVALPVAVLWGMRSREQLSLVGAENFAEAPSDILNMLY